MSSDPANAQLRHYRAQEDQKCPMCGDLVAKGAAVCRSCGADLTRSGVVFSTVTPLARKALPKKRERNPVLLTAIVLLGVLGALAMAASLSPIGAHVPGMQTINALPRLAYQRVMSLGNLIRRPSSPAPQAPAAAQPAPTPAPTTTAPTEPAILSSVTILSDPPGAQVKIDDEESGSTPLTIEKVAPGQHKVAIQHTGYQGSARTFTIVQGESLTLSMTLRPIGQPARKPAPPVAVKPAPVASRKPLAVGVEAPLFALKDRVGVIYRLDELRGQRVAVLLIWSLDASGRSAIRDLANLSMKRGGQYLPIVIAIRPDRVAIRQFIASERIRVPILFGNAEIADQYGVSAGTSVLYVISERGIIVQRHRSVDQLAWVRRVIFY